ncbi:uncharacterized protein LOC107038009 [Diachasma alloeum]|uniref:uncharacterized protein LOC107038009 n=1 Tax=Diachasma alloeum TaxID=454923 RepID=UPI0007381174|nr:uncharacterized protein LOC107038009 [Diachasma alloeum]
MTSLSLQDIQSLLRSTLGDELTVESYITEDLLPPGENYGSIMSSVHVIIKNHKQGKSEELQLVAKSPPPVEMQREITDCSIIFRKEIFMYSKLIPFYQNLEIASGVRKEDVFKVSPMCYGSKLSVHSGDSDDYDAVILLENLKPSGYYCVDRRFGCDLAHARLAVRTMARFHALGMAAKEKDPDFFEVVKAEAKAIDIVNPEMWEALFQQRIKDITDDPELEEYHEACRQALSQKMFESWKAVPSEPWSTIVHADFWTNNMMFRDNSEGEPEDMKLVDFQTYLFASPMRELTFFVTGGLELDAIDHIDELIDLYYDTLIGRLKLLSCNVEPYSRRSFEEKVREDAYVEIVHNVAMIKIVTQDIHEKGAEAPDLINLLQSHDNNEIYERRLRKLVRTYGEKGWLKK